MIVLVTDFGRAGPYIGQMEAAIRNHGAGVDIVHLFDEAPMFDPKATAYLLAAYVHEFPPGSIFLCVVDPGVGTERGAGVLNADKRWYVGPDNGLFEVVVRRAARAEWWALGPAPEGASQTFHGRDIFAPVAASLANGGAPPGRPSPIGEVRRTAWPDDLAAVVFIDHYGNAMTGTRASQLPAGARMHVGAHTLERARTFAAVPPGQAFWYENANGLAEIAVNRGRADAALTLGVGTPVTFELP